MFGDEIKALVLELELPGFEQAGAQRAATLTMTYDKLTDSGVTREKNRARNHHHHRRERARGRA
ncbi:MAG: hypothetical protein HND48_13155 [Chloroflexi bacterium]|nr:hypothetical protein [Chloroflexota bacterium]